MLIRNRFYDGVPVGSKEFSDLFKSVNGHMDSLLKYALSPALRNNINTRNGGSLIGNEVVIKLVDNFWVMSSTGASAKGILFAKTEDNGSDNYFVEEIVYADSTLPVNEWEVLATGNDKNFNRLRYQPAILPKFPVARRQNAFVAGEFYAVTYNGIPQSSYTYGEAGLVFDKLQLGAEYPTPIQNGVFVDTFNPKTMSDWVRDFGVSTNADGSVIQLRFKHSNFSFESPYIVLREVYTVGSSRSYNYHVMYEDKSPDPNSISSNSFKVVDRANGVVRLKLNSNFVRFALRSSSSNPLFSIIVPEQLVSEVTSGGISYKSRYGAVYGGNSSSVELIALNLEGVQPDIKPIVNDISSIASSDVIHNDKSSSLGDVVLAIRYDAESRVDIAAQRNKFYPDVLKLYYSTAVPNVQAGNKQEVKAFVDKNKGSWYNMNVALGEYKPVSRVEKGVVTLCTEQMAVAKGIDPATLIDPDELLTLSSNAALPEYKYAHQTKVTLGVNDKYVRTDAVIPEPHHINPPMIKMYLPADEELYVPAEEQMVVHRRYRVEGRLIIDGFFVVD